MRSEAEMLSLILTVASGDERVRAVVLDGSRTNPAVPRDILQDYDITYVVSALGQLVRERAWLAPFGRPIIVQTPDEMEVPEPGGRSDGFAFLMLFDDGNRVDLSLHASDGLDTLQLDEWSRILLDKDRRLQAVPRGPSPYRNVAPTAKRYADCCNEFWWVNPYVAKGLWRHELPYAKAMQDRVVRPMLDLMLTWWIGVRQGFDVQVGKSGKYLEARLEPRHWRAYLSTYADGEYDGVWMSLFAMGELFRAAATHVAERMRFTYPRDDDERVTAYLHRVHGLPRDAVDM